MWFVVCLHTGSYHVYWPQYISLSSSPCMYRQWCPPWRHQLEQHCSSSTRRHIQEGIPYRFWLRIIVFFQWWFCWAHCESSSFLLSPVLIIFPGDIAIYGNRNVDEKSKVELRKSWRGVYPHCEARSRIPVLCPSVPLHTLFWTWSENEGNRPAEIAFERATSRMGRPISILAIIPFHRSSQNQSYDQLWNNHCCQDITFFPSHHPCPYQAAWEDVSANWSLCKPISQQPDNTWEDDWKFWRDDSGYCCQWRHSLRSSPKKITTYSCFWRHKFVIHIFRPNITAIDNFPFSPSISFYHRNILTCIVCGCKLQILALNVSLHFSGTVVLLSNFAYDWNLSTCIQ